MGWRFLLGILAVLLTACGNVVVDQRGSGGDTASAGDASGANGSAATGKSTGSVSTNSMSTTSGLDPALCDSFCAVANNCIDSCHHNCAAYQIAPCASQGAALVTCLSQHFDASTCQANGCDSETQAFTQCRSSSPQNCGGSGGSGGGADCDYTAVCPGGEERIVCDIQGQTAQCTCYLNFLSVGKCQSTVGPSDPEGPPTDPSDVCLQMGCCGQFFGT